MAAGPFAPIIIGLTTWPLSTNPSPWFMPLQTVEPQRLYRQIAEQLRALIATGEFSPGSRLPAERDLAKQLGVSRPSVREALIALEVEGVIDVRTGSGIYVRATYAVNGAGAARREEEHDPGEWGPLELMRARELVEGEVAALAARNARRPQIAEIASALSQMREEAGAGIIPRAGDEAFHTAVAQACGNEVLRDTVRGYWHARSGPLFERLGDYFENPASWNAALVEHSAVLDAIRAHDPAAARLAMQAHLKKAYTRYSASWRRANAS
jgi:DNA-binding FadR family transcriptional regulator